MYVPHCTMCILLSFHSFLIANPDAKPVFKKFAGLDITEDSTLPVVNDYAMRMMKGLNELMLNVDNPSKQKEQLNALSMQCTNVCQMDKKYFKARTHTHFCF